MKSNVCSKCGAREVRAGQGFWAKDAANFIAISPMTAWRGGKVAAVDHYVCAACGDVETYVSDASNLEYIAANWPRVE